jgi:nucleotide-binding universal stress UspA family protein
MKILVAIDNESAGPVVDFLLRQNWVGGTEFRVATVYDTTSEEYHAAELSPTPYLAERALGEKQQLMVDATAERLKKIYPEAITSSCLLNGDIAESLALEAHKWGADLIAIGSHHKHGLEKWLNGSVSESVMHCSNCSILVVPIKVVPIKTSAPEKSQIQEVQTTSVR